MVQRTAGGTVERERESEFGPQTDAPYAHAYFHVQVLCSLGNFNMNLFGPSQRGLNCRTHIPKWSYSQSETLPPGTSPVDLNLMTILTRKLMMSFLSTYIEMNYGIADVYD